jgi:hypothetical protein
MRKVERRCNLRRRNAGGQSHLGHLLVPHLSAPALAAIYSERWQASYPRAIESGRDKDFRRTFTAQWFDANIDEMKFHVVKMRVDLPGYRDEPRVAAAGRRLKPPIIPVIHRIATGSEGARYQP